MNKDVSPLIHEGHRGRATRSWRKPTAMGELIGSMDGINQHLLSVVGSDSSPVLQSVHRCSLEREPP
jgi:hypothetical protein